MGAYTGVLRSEPQHKVDDLVYDIVGRREDAIEKMQPELQKLLLALVDQFAALRNCNPNIDLRKVKFERTRWINDSGRGVLVFDISYNGRPLLPTDVRYW